jgi:restriction endonuclease S subunit
MTFSEFCGPDVDAFKEDTGIKLKTPKPGKEEFINPVSKDELKELFAAQIKDEAIKFGNLEDAKNLSANVKDALNNQRDFNLSFENQNEGTVREAKFELTRIDDLFILEYGKPLKEENRLPGAYPVYGSNGIVGYHNSYLLEAPFIIIGRKGSAGSVHYSKQKGYPIDTTYYVKIDNEEKILSKYAYHILVSLDLMRLNNSAGVPGLNRNDVHKLEIPLPPIEVQKEIVTELDVYQEVIQSCEGLSKNYAPALPPSKLGNSQNG